MPFCTQCGNKVGDVDFYCGRCGSRQPSTLPPPPPLPPVAPLPPVDPLAGVSPRTFSILCYVPIVGWVAAAVVLGTRRFRSDLALRFHAFQGLYIFAAWLLVDWVVHPIFSSLPHHVFRLDILLHVLLIGVWVFMLIKTTHGESYSLPVLGELAQRSAHER